MDTLVQWLATPAGQQLVEWQTREAAAIVGNVFGYHAVEIGVGVPDLDMLKSAKVLHKIKVDASIDRISGAVEGPVDAMPWCDDVFNLIVAHHVVDCYPQTQVVEELTRSVAPEGVLCVFGLNRNSLTGASASLRAIARRPTPPASSSQRLAAALRGAGMEILMTRFGCHHLLANTKWLRQATRPIGALIGRVLPLAGSGYIIVARKRSFIRPMRLKDRFRGRVGGAVLADPAGFRRGANRIRQIDK